MTALYAVFVFRKMQRFVFCYGGIVTDWRQEYIYRFKGDEIYDSGRPAMNIKNGKNATNPTQMPLSDEEIQMLGPWYMDWSIHWLDRACDSVKYYVTFAQGSHIVFYPGKCLEITLN
jgi:hypothetical protein